MGSAQRTHRLCPLRPSNARAQQSLGPIARRRGCRRRWPPPPSLSYIPTPTPNLSNAPPPRQNNQRQQVLIEHGIHWLEHKWSHRRGHARSTGLLTMLSFIKTELFLLGLISMILTAVQEPMLRIWCVFGVGPF